MKLNGLLIGCCSALIAASILGFVLTRDGTSEIDQNTEGMTINPENKDLVSLGKEVYLDSCAACHGFNLEGQKNWRLRKPDGKLPAPPHDETGHTWHHPDQMLFDITKLGTQKVLGIEYKTDMIGFGDVHSDKEIWAALSYIKSTWPEDVRALHDGINDHAAQSIP